LPPLKIFLLDNQKIFLGFGAEIAPSSLKMAAPLFTLSKGGGVQTVVFWSNLRPSYYAITGRGPAGPPLATALQITFLSIVYCQLSADLKNIDVVLFKNNLTV
jgi:hypothetical protein